LTGSSQGHNVQLAPSGGRRNITKGGGERIKKKPVVI